MARIIRATAGDSRIPAGFPILMSDSMVIIEPAHKYLMRLAVVPGRSHAPDTIRAYSEHLVGWFDSLEQTGNQWDRVDERVIAAYRNLHLEGVSPHTGRPYATSTINDRLRTICRFYKFAHKRHWIDELPFVDDADVPVSTRRQPMLIHTERDPYKVKANELTLPEYERRPRALTGQQVRLLFNHLKMPYALMGEWALTTGLRRKEVCGLTCHQIPESQDLEEQDHQSVGLAVTVTKNSKERTIEVPLRLLDRTHHYIDQIREPAVRARIRRDRKYRRPNKLFIGQRAQPITRKRMTDAFSDAFKAAKVAGSLHWLRHTFAFTMLRALQKTASANKSINPLLELQDLMGHESIATTAKYLRGTGLDDDEINENIAFLYGALIDDLEPEPVHAAPTAQGQFPIAEATDRRCHAGRHSRIPSMR